MSIQSRAKQTPRQKRCSKGGSPITFNRLGNYAQVEIHGKPGFVRAFGTGARIKASNREYVVNRNGSFIRQ